MAGQEVLTDEQILTRFKSDPTYAIQFAIDNNYPQILANLNSMGYLEAMQPLQVANLLNDWYINDRAKVVAALAGVQYQNEVDNYTGQMETIFANALNVVNIQNTGTGGTRAFLGLTFDNLLNGLGGFFTGLGTGGQLPPTGTSYTAEQLAAIEAANAAAKKKEEEEQRKRTTTIIIVSIAVAFLLGTLIYLGTRQPKTKAE